MSDAIIVLNAGSSSLKFSVYRVRGGDRIELAAKGQVEGIGASPHFIAKDAEGGVLAEERWPDDRDSRHDHYFRVFGQWVRGFLRDGQVLGVGPGSARRS